MIIKKCKIHGDLTHDKVYCHKRTYPNGNVTKRIICKECCSKKSLDSYHKHREKRRAYANEYAKNNREKRNENRKQWGKENKDHLLIYKRNANKEETMLLKKTYLKKLLKKEFKFDSALDIPNDLVDFKFALMSLKRKIRDLSK